MIRINLQSPSALLAFLFLVLLDTSQADDIGVYWGQNSDEGSLAKTCATGKYYYVSIAFFYAFENGQNPEIHLGFHCDLDPSNGCAFVSSDIRSCQKQGIKVMALSIGGVGTLFNQSIFGDPKHLSDNLWNNFLGGNSSSRPLGDAMLDGIDFVTESYSRYREDLARYLKSTSTQNFLHHLNARLTVLRTLPLLLDYLTVFGVQFFGSPQCQYKDGNIDALVKTWNQWSTLKVGTIFLGLLAFPIAGASGYIPADLLNCQILPIIR